MKTDQMGASNTNQKQASPRLTNEAEKQINPSVKFDPRQETSERAAQKERGSHAAEPTKTVESAPTVDSTVGGL